MKTSHSIDLHWWINKRGASSCLACKSPNPSQRGTQTLHPITMSLRDRTVVHSQSNLVFVWPEPSLRALNIYMPDLAKAVAARVTVCARTGGWRKRKKKLFGSALDWTAGQKCRREGSAWFPLCKWNMLMPTDVTSCRQSEPLIKRHVLCQCLLQEIHLAKTFV